MKRREALWSFGATALTAAVALDLVEAVQKGELSEEHVEAWLRSVANVEPLPQEAEHIRSQLSRIRAVSDTDPRGQPAIAFNPEVES